MFRIPFLVVTFKSLTQLNLSGRAASTPSSPMSALLPSAQVPTVAQRLRCYVSYCYALRGYWLRPQRWADWLVFLNLKPAGTQGASEPSVCGEEIVQKTPRSQLRSFIDYSENHFSLLYSTFSIFIFSQIILVIWVFILELYYK